VLIAWVLEGLEEHCEYSPRSSHAMHETFASCGWYCPAAHAVHAVTSPPAETYLPRGTRSTHKGYSEYSQRVLTQVLTWATRSTLEGTPQ
jgi:hypothetical protein